MDDIVDASMDKNTLVVTQNQVNELIGKFGFEEKTWYNNNSQVGTVIERKKVLGLLWTMSDDNLKPAIGFSKPLKISKRSMLARISEVWDPLGTLAGVLMTGKLLFQAVVRLKTGWDIALNDQREIVERWNSWLEELEKCNDVIVPRSVSPSVTLKDEHLKCELLGFSDGSSVGYGCVIYVRWSNDDMSKVEVRFLCA